MHNKPPSPCLYQSLKIQTVCKGFTELIEQLPWLLDQVLVKYSALEFVQRTMSAWVNIWTWLEKTKSVHPTELRETGLFVRGILNPVCGQWWIKPNSRQRLFYCLSRSWSSPSKQDAFNFSFGELLNILEMDVIDPVSPPFLFHSILKFTWASNLTRQWELWKLLLVRIYKLLNLSKCPAVWLVWKYCSEKWKSYGKKQTKKKHVSCGFWFAEIMTCKTLELIPYSVEWLVQPCQQT